MTESVRTEDTKEYKDTFLSFHLENTNDPQAFFNLSAEEQSPAAWAADMTPNEAALKYFKSGKDITGVMQGYDRKFDLNTFDNTTTQKGIVVYLITDALESFDQRALIDFADDLKKNKPNCRLIAMHVENRDSELRDCDEVKKHAVLGGSIPLIQVSAQKGLEANERGKNALLLRFLEEPGVQANLSSSVMRRASARVSNFFSFGKKASSDVNAEAQAEETTSRASVGDVEAVGDHELGGRDNRGSLVTRPKAFESVYAPKEAPKATAFGDISSDDEADVNPAAKVAVAQEEKTQATLDAERRFDQTSQAAAADLEDNRSNFQKLMQQAQAQAGGSSRTVQQPAVKKAAVVADPSLGTPPPVPSVPAPAVIPSAVASAAPEVKSTAAPSVPAPADKPAVGKLKMPSAIAGLFGGGSKKPAEAKAAPAEAAKASEETTPAKKVGKVKAPEGFDAMFGAVARKGPPPAAIAAPGAAANNNK
jgi:hypothetical protein